MNDIQPFGYRIDDTFVKYDTRSLLCGKTFTEYHKRILLEVIRYYASKQYKGGTQTENDIIAYVQSVFDRKPNVTYDELMKLFHATTNECMLAYILVAYNDEHLDMILRCMYTFCRVLPFDSSTEWYDNYRLNNYGNPLNMIMWSNYDCNDVYVISKTFPNDIDTSVKINFNKVVRRLVGSLRAFIIDHGLFPNEAPSGNSSVVSNGNGNVVSNGNPPVNSSAISERSSTVTIHEPMYDTPDFGNGFTGGSKTKRMPKPNSKTIEASKCKPGSKANTSTSRADITPTSKLTSKSAHRTRNVKAYDRNITTDYYSFVNKRYTRRMDKLKASGSRSMSTGSSNTSSTGGVGGVSGGDIEVYASENTANTPFRAGKSDPLSKGYTAEQICDECYKHYPYYFGGAHGCDVFDTYLSLTIEELDAFFNRYPSARVGYILNTATYASGHGEHWVALELSKGKAKLICSQASDFNTFHDDGRLHHILQTHMYGLEYNMVRFQSDSYSCGIFSALSLYELLITGSIQAAVGKIGINGTGIKDGMDIDDIREKWASTK